MSKSDNLSVEALSKLIAQKERILQELSKRSLDAYKPYAKQRDFHRDGLTFFHRLFMAGNQLGKTLGGGAELAFHLIGNYPEWWDGKVFRGKVMAWAAGNSAETTRDNPQRMLFGRPGEWGTGMIPARCIKEKKMARGIADLIDFAQISSLDGSRMSTIGFKTYDQGRLRWQGETLDILWFDEEPPIDIYNEGLTRLNAGDGGRGGISFITATPLLGRSEVIRGFYPEPTTSTRSMVQMTIDDVGHYTEARKKEIIESYSPHERESRARGIPMLGSGAVFPVQPSMLEVDSFPIPDHWARINGSDFGWDHPTAFVQCAIDRDTGCFYVVDCYRQAEQVVAIHAASVRPWGSWIPTAWPHDGYVHDKQSGKAIAKSYSDEGLKMRIEHATHRAGGYGVEAGVQEMLQAMQTGRFKVFKHLQDWWNEFHAYHRKDGQIVKEVDDLMAATRIAWMDRRFACVKPVPVETGDVGVYEPFGEVGEEVYH